MNDSKPYYAVIFTSKQNGTDSEYAIMAAKMEKLAKLQPGYIGIESARNDIGITISYWETLDTIKRWKENTAHLFAQEKGKSNWYSWYKVRICKVEREYEFENTNLL